MNQFVSPFALDLHRAHVARQANYAAISISSQEKMNLRLIARSEERREREEAAKRLRAEIAHREFLIHEAARAFVCGVALAMNPNAFRSKIKVGHIQEVVARHFNVKLSDMCSARRTANVVEPRQVAMYLAKVMTPRSMPDIGRRFGDRDHTTVLHAVRKITARMAVDDDYRAKVETLRAEIMMEVGKRGQA
jgi:chromosomal replication initiation ATPase DnaA